MEGYINIDLYSPSADVRADFLTLHYKNVEEIVASHVLEHLPWAKIPGAFDLLAGWLRPGGTLIVEVPDMTEIMKMGTEDLWWISYVYGAQINEGEFHKSGFSHDLLVTLLEQSGLSVIHSRCFRSRLPQRNDYPCIEATAKKGNL